VILRYAAQSATSKSGSSRSGCGFRRCFAARVAGCWALAILCQEREFRTIFMRSGRKATCLSQHYLPKEWRYTNASCPNWSGSVGRLVCSRWARPMAIFWSVPRAPTGKPRALNSSLSVSSCMFQRCRSCRGKLQDVPLERGSYDVIVMWDVIEHLTDIGEVLDSVFALLRSGGALVAERRTLGPCRGRWNVRSGLPTSAYPANAASTCTFHSGSLALADGKEGLPAHEVDTHSEWESELSVAETLSFVLCVC